jgi:Spy/CpxP family protein refolding chaperone
MNVRAEVLAAAVAALTAAMVMAAAAIASRSTARGFSRTTAVGFDAGGQRQAGGSRQHQNTEETIHGNSP